MCVKWKNEFEGDFHFVSPKVHARTLKAGADSVLFPAAPQLSAVAAAELCYSQSHSGATVTLHPWRCGGNQLHNIRYPVALPCRFAMSSLEVSRPNAGDVGINVSVVQL